MIRPLYIDPFNAVLLASPALEVTLEQTRVIKEILDICCSDTQFADKAYRAITKVLTGGSVVPPAVTSLTPNSAEVGDANFTLHVHGTGFKNTDKIIFAGQEEPTTFVSATELTTGVNMSVWLGPDALPVVVQSADGVISNAMTFTFTDGTPAALVAGSSNFGTSKSVKEPVQQVKK